MIGCLSPSHFYQTQMIPRWDNVTGVTNLPRVQDCGLFAETYTTERNQTPHLSDSLVSQDVFMFTLGFIVRTEGGKQERRSWGSKQIGLRYFDNDRKMMRRWVMERCGSRKERRAGGRLRGLLLSNCLAAFCCLGPRPPRRFSSVESHESGSSGTVSVRSATGQLTQMLLLSSGGTPDTILYLFPYLTLHGWGNH